MDTLKNFSEIGDYVQSRKDSGQKVALVPTLGALHEGHMELVRQGLKQADICIPYIFLNPAQFAPHEDLDSYPRTLDKDLKKLASTGAQAVWVPSAEDVYPDGIEIDTKAGDIARPLEGECRPHFFDGVVTVLKRMFEASRPDIVMMGEKDYQQLLVVRQMVKDQNMPIDIIGVPTIRDENGLALSSRNAYLNEQDYDVAIHLNKILFEMSERYQKNEEPEFLEKWAISELLNAGFDKVDYCVIRDSQTLSPEIQHTPRILAAAWIGKTRLIDNIPVS